MGSDGSEALRHADVVSLDTAAPRAVRLDANALERARLTFHRTFPRRSAKRPHVTQILWVLAVGALLIWALREHPARTLAVLQAVALGLFGLAIAWRLLAAAHISPILRRLATPSTFPVYTILCPLYREANVAADLMSALARLDYPGME